jgi:DNA mismatch repair protein MutS2
MSADEHLSHMVEKYTSLYEELEKSKKQIIKEAQKVAVNIIEESNKTIEKTIRDIKEAEADKEKTKLLRENLEKTRKNLLVEAESLNPKSEKKPKTRKQKEKKPAASSTTNPLKEPEIGDFVQIVDSDIQGEIMEFSGDTAILNVNEVKLKTSRKKLVVIDKPTTQKIKKRSGLSNIINELNQKVANFSMTIDLRGKRAEEAMYELSKYIDECLLLNIYEVDILHGKGSGILRDIIRDYLKSVPEISRFSDAPLEQGGGGITRVSFNR